MIDGGAVSPELGALVRWAEGALATSATPRLDAELLLAASAGIRRNRILAFPEQTVAAAPRRAFERLVRARATGVPLAYLTGIKEFYTLTLKVTPAVLVPRPETELLVEQALAHWPSGPAPRVLDLGTGAGAVALAIKQARPAASVIGTDASEAALEVARENARDLGLAVEWRCSDWFAALGTERYELIVANPPYVESAAIADGPLRHEPRLALDGGSDGLAALARILDEAPAHLARGGVLLLEHGATQRAALLERAAATGAYAAGRGYSDLAGLDRVLVLERAR